MTRKNPYYHATRGDLARQILKERKLKAHPAYKYDGRRAVFAGDTRSSTMADDAMSWADTKHSIHFGAHPEEENVLIEFDAKTPDERRGPEGTEAVWFDDVEMVEPKIVRRRPGRSLWPNAIPSPAGAYPQMLAWAERTYAPGTPVKFSGGGYSWRPGRHSNVSSSDLRVLVPDETRGVVDAVIGDDYDRAVWVHVQVVDARPYAHAAAAPPGEKSSWMVDDIHDLWEVLDDRKTTVVSDIVGSNALNKLIPLRDNWATAPSPLKRSTLPSSQKRTSRKLRPNPAPPPPTHRPIAHPAYIGWHKRTFAPGTRVRYRKAVNVWVPKGRAGQTVPLPAGTRGEVVAWIGPDQWGAKERVSIRLYDNRSYMPHDQDRSTMDWVFDQVFAGGDPVVVDSVTNLYDRLDALDDNWVAATPIGRAQLPASQKRTSRKLRPNLEPSVPYPFGGDMSDRVDWSQRTYAVGTPVKFLRGRDEHGRGFLLSDVSGYLHPPVGARGQVVRVHPGNWIEVELVDARDPSGARIDNLIGQRVLISVIAPQYTIEPLVDNWASQGYRRASRPKPNRRTSRRRTSRR